MITALRQGYVNYKKVGPLGVTDLFYAMAKQGVLSFLILYLVQTLGMRDFRAQDFMATNEIVTYTIPFVSSMMLSTYVSAHQGALWGLLFMGLGCVGLYVGDGLFLPVGMGFFLFGYGIGKPMLPILVSSKVGLSSTDKAMRVRYLYAIGSLGSFVSPLVMGVMGSGGNWRNNFLYMALFCLVGFVVTFLVVRREGLHRHVETNAAFWHSALLAVAGAFLCAVPFLIPHLRNGLMLGVFLWVGYFILSTHQKLGQEDRILFKKFFMTVGWCVVFFIFQSQEYLLFPLYVERFVDRTMAFVTFETPWFHIVPSLGVLILTPFLSGAFEGRGRGFDHAYGWKLLWSFGTLSLCFFMMFSSTLFRGMGLFFALLAYGLFCVGEFFLVTSTQEIMNSLSSEFIKKRLMGVLYLSMAFARWGGIFLLSTLYEINDINKESINMSSFDLLIFYTLITSLIVFLGLILKNITFYYLRK